MRFIHTADWHLGRLFYGARLTDDQAFVLDQVVELARDTRPDAVLVAGDVYDRAVPPPEAVALLDDVLSRLVLGLGVPVVMIAGNHDSPDRLSFGARLLAEKGLYVAGRVASRPECIVLRDEAGPVHICAIPFAEPAVVRAAFGNESLHDHHTALAAVMQAAWAGIPAGARAVAVAHAFVCGGEAGESERPLSVGGSGTVDASLFHGFAYAALGHLHRAQAAEAVAVPGRASPGVSSSQAPGLIRYAGSLLTYSFAEAAHAPSVTLVEIDAVGRAQAESVALRPRHDVRQISGLFKDLLRGDVSRAVGGSSVVAGGAGALGAVADGRGGQLSLEPTTAGGVGAIGGGGVEPASAALDDYLAITLLDKAPVLDAMARLRGRYPNLVHVERQEVLAAASRGAAVDHRRRTEDELFAAFFDEASGEALTPAEQEAFSRVADEVRRRDREAS